MFSSFSEQHLTLPTRKSGNNIKLFDDFDQIYSKSLTTVQSGVPRTSSLGPKNVGIILLHTHKELQKKWLRI